jgi:hypothetical protein
MNRKARSGVRIVLDSIIMYLRIPAEGMNQTPFHLMWPADGIRNGKTGELL